MRRPAFVFCIIVLSFLGGVSPVFVSTAQNSATQNYVVQYGDTLWDIAGTYLGNPYRWHEIHQNNPFITNPNLIYPGDILDIGPGLPVPAEKPEEMVVEKKVSDKRISRPWYGVPAPTPEKIPLPQPPRILVGSPDYIEALGYIAPYSLKELEAAQFGQISGFEYQKGEEYPQLIHAEVPRPGLIFGDIIYINRGSAQDVREGDVFLGFRPLREIYHPLTKELLGTQILILGRLRIKTLEPEVSCAEIIKSYNYMEIGTPILPVSELSIPLKKPLVGNAHSYGFKVGNQLIAHIVAERVGRHGMSSGDIVFIDVGAAQGVQPSDSFIIFREIKEGFPIQSIGRLTVLSVQKQTASAMIVESVKTVELGEKVVLMR